jgi:nickel/cobalt transporter (NicO) family protein
MNIRTSLAATAAVAAGLSLIGGGAANAHPLGNFSVNHLNALTFETTGISNAAIIDIAEIPSTQAFPDVDSDGNGLASSAELSGYSVAQCTALAAAQSVRVDGSVVPFIVTSSSFTYAAGSAGISTSRLECGLVAATELSSRSRVEFVDAFEEDRVGWHEITAVGNGIALVDSPVASVSVTDGLRTYPVDLLSSPMDVRQVSLDIQPDASVRAASSVGSATPAASADGSTASVGGSADAAIDRVGAYSSRFGSINRAFDRLIGERDLTLGVGLLAVALALVLGASHALLPGHGKTVMAAYIAGRQGSARDAVMVGATVTATHTGGVLLLGMALTVSSSLAGEVVLGWLGVSSGVLVAGLGVALLIGLLRRRAAGQPAQLHGHSHSGRFGHRHDHGNHHAGHGHDHDHDDHHAGHGHNHDHDDHDAGHGHDHDHGDHDAGHGHDHDHDDHHSHHRELVGVGGGGERAEVGASNRSLEHAVQSESLVRHHHTHEEHDHVHEPEPARPYSRRGLVAMGIAGGLVPSPSALIILLSAIALGRTAFGALLVVAYGLGMAATLTLAGIALVVIRNRYQDRLEAGTGRVNSISRRWLAVAPYATATLVVIVGIGLTIRSTSML